MLRNRCPKYAADSVVAQHLRQVYEELYANNYRLRLAPGRLQNVVERRSSGMIPLYQLFRVLNDIAVQLPPIVNRPPVVAENIRRMRTYGRDYFKL